MELNDPILQDVLTQIGMEVVRATRKFGPFASAHEGYAIIKEELDELWDDVKENRLVDSSREAVQVGAMAARYLIDLDPHRIQ